MQTDRQLRLLRIICAEGPLTMDAIAAQAELPLSTAYRYVSTLRNLGFVDRNGHRFDAGPAAIQLLRGADTGTILGRTAAPTLEDIAVRTGSTAMLTVPTGWTAVCVESAEPREPVRLSYRRGVALPLHVSASAKPLLAHLPGRTVEEYLRFMIGTGVGDRIGSDRVRRQLLDIRRTGVCVTANELDPETMGVGIPLFLDRTIAACLSVAGHQARLTPRLAEIVDTLRSASRAIVATWTGHSAKSAIDNDR